MAEAVLGGVIRVLGKAILNQVSGQASLVLNFRKDFEWLQSKLQDVTSFLQDAHLQKNERVKKWLLDVQDIAYDAEDMVEECAVRPNSVFFRYKMGRRIKELKDKMESVMKDAEHIGLAQTISHFDQRLTCHDDRAEEQKKSSLIESDARPVAIDAKVQDIINLLIEDALQVLAVVGMGGIGKTFLLQNVFYRVREKFEKAIWLSISQMYYVSRLQSDIASHLNLKDEIKDVSEQRAAELIHESLQDKRSLIVLDDVWRVQNVNNLLQRLGIPLGTSNRCKVVVTTRSMEVCIGASNIYPMELLSEHDSWNLFRLHAFPQNRPSQEIEEVAHQVERECGRLPLAIKTVAASMASNELLSDWEYKLRQLIEVSDPRDPIMPILRLTYDALPTVLKPCFLYFSFFGEDEQIDAERLIYSWMGESFIPGEEKWSTGLSYLNQLKNLCVIEVSENGELEKTCKMHDLLRDLAIYISKENKCAFTVGEASASGCRRILLAKKGIITAGFKCSSSLRTLSLSQNPIKELPRKSFRGVRALRVIDLSGTDIRVLPRCMGNLKLLKVLNLSKTGFTKVPDCVRNLKSLCFLDVSGCSLPNWIGDLICLQHLHVRRVDYSSKISTGISKLVSLRTFRSNYSRVVVKDVAKLIHLQELFIDIVNENEEERRSVEEGVLEQLVNMRKLTINDYTTHFLCFPEKMKAMKDLQYLVLWGFTVPRWICEYGNLKVLKLTFCHWSQYPTLHTMPNLMKLELNGHSEDFSDLPELFGKPGAFPQLRYFQIAGFWKLPDLQDGAMPFVEEIKLFSRKKKQNIPQGFEYLRSLKLLCFSCDEQSAEQFKVYTHRKNQNIPEGSDYLRSLKLLCLGCNEQTAEEFKVYSRREEENVPGFDHLGSLERFCFGCGPPEEEDKVFIDEEIERLKEGGEYWNKIKATNPHVTIRFETMVSKWDWESLLS